MKILGLHDGHNASVAVFDDTKILSAVSEERLNREKFYWGFPHESVVQALHDAGVALADIDVIAVSHLSPLGYLRRLLSLRTTYTWRPKILAGHILNVFRAAKRARDIRALARTAHAAVYFCDHHRAHAMSAFFCSGWKSALVVTIDGLGDSLSHTAHDVRDGQWRMLAQGGPNASLGAFYAAVTEGLGFTPNRHEGKVVGLAALASGEAARQYLAPLVSIEQQGLSFRRSGYAAMLAAVHRAQDDGVSREDIAACAQTMLEELVIAHIRKLREESSARHIVCAGGVFANVKLNQRILETGLFDDIFIQPAMGDEGLVLGAPFAYLLDTGHAPQTHRLEHVYFGNAASETDIQTAVGAGAYTLEHLKNPSEDVAQRIAAGELVGWFDGRMEFGPRALGARSIMADPRNKEVNALLNKRLRRSEFMPFAPSALREEADAVFDMERGGRFAAEFMTITFNVRDAWREKVPAIVHEDGTARPQLVRADISPNYHAVIKAFYEETGVPLVVNTSFNIHEEPIVATPADALRSLDSGAVDCVVFNAATLVRRRQ